MRWDRVGRVVQRSSLYVLLFLLPISKAAIEITFPLLLVGWLMEQIQTGWKDSVWRRPTSQQCLVGLLGYLGICALSIVTSTHPGLSLSGFAYKTLEYALMFVVAADVVKESAVIQRCLQIVMASSFVVGVDAVAQEVIGRDLLLGHRLSIYGRMTGPYETPIDLATYLMVAIPIVFAHLGVASVVKTWWRGMLGVLLVGCLVRTQSQGAWLGLLSGLFVTSMIVRRLRRPVLIGSVSLLGVVGLFILQADGHLPKMFDIADVGTYDRLYMWQAAWRMIQDRPMMGHGLNTFMANYLTYWVGGERQPRYAHNCYLQVAAETGVLGLTTFLWFLGAMGSLWWRAINTVPDGPVRSRLLGLVAGLVAFLVQSLYDTNFYSLRQAALFWTLAGLTTGLAVNALRGSGALKRTP